MTRVPLFYDLQGAQSVEHRDRGIARYVVALAVAIEAADPERVDAFVLNPDLALPGGIEPLVASGKLRFAGDVDVPAGAVVHLPSTIELAIPIERLFPDRVRRTPLTLVVTLHDLVQEAMPGEYLQDAGVRRRYRTRLELVRQADAVIAVSAHSAREATRLLGIPPERLTPVPEVPSPAFRPAASIDDAAAAARAAVPGLRERFVLYTAGSDGRKNVERLIEAWSLLPTPVRTAWQLVIACHLPPLRRNHFDVMAAGLGLGEGFLTTGFVEEATLVHLNQAAGLAVMPSLDEGFGLPVAEALACGTPVIGSDRTSIPELLTPEALFDPTDPAAMADAIRRALEDGPHRRRLSAWAARPVRTWADVAASTMEVYDRIAVTGRRRPQRRAASVPRIAFTTPLPPQPGGVADYSTRLLEKLAGKDLVVDVFVDGPPRERAAIMGAQAPAGLAARPLSSLRRVEALLGPYDHIVYSLGNSEFHTGSLAALHERPGVVVAHDVRLTNLYRFAAWQHPAAVQGGFHQSLQRMYAGAVPPQLGRDGHVSSDDAERWGLLMAREAIAWSTRYLVTSSFAAQLARLDARPDDRGKIGVLPFGIGSVPLADPPPADGRVGPAVVASFGVLNALKQGRLVVDAFADATGRLGLDDALLVFVGPAAEADAAAITARAAELGLAHRLRITGHVSRTTYREWLARAWAAVQLRSMTNGESSAAIGDCLAAAIPTIVTAIGANRALPEGAALTVPVGADASVVADALRQLLDQPALRRHLGDGALHYAAAQTFDAAAETLYRLVPSPDCGPG